MQEIHIWLGELYISMERSSFGEVVRSTPFLYPTLESLHILGIALLVGSAVAFDLRLLGIGNKFLPVTNTYCLYPVLDLP